MTCNISTKFYPLFNLKHSETDMAIYVGWITSLRDELSSIMNYSSEKDIGRYCLRLYDTYFTLSWIRIGRYLGIDTDWPSSPDL